MKRENNSDNKQAYKHRTTSLRTRICNLSLVPVTLNRQVANHFQPIKTRSRSMRSYVHGLFLLPKLRLIINRNRSNKLSASCLFFLPNAGREQISFVVCSQLTK